MVSYGGNAACLTKLGLIAAHSSGKSDSCGFEVELSYQGGCTRGNPGMVFVATSLAAGRAEASGDTRKPR